MYKYLDTYEVNFEIWDVYALTDSDFYPDFIAITGPDDYLQNLYNNPGMLEEVKTDFSRGINFHQAGNLDEVLHMINRAA